MAEESERAILGLEDMDSGDENTKPEDDKEEKSNESDDETDDSDGESTDEDADDESDDDEESEEADAEDDDSSDDEDEEESDESEDDDELDEDLDEEGDEDVSLYKSLKKSHPDILKKFPQLKDAIFRDEQFSRSFVTPEEASSASQALKIYSRMEADISSGDMEPLLKSLEATDKDAYENLVHSLLPTIEKRSKELYGEILAKPFKQALRQAFAQGNKAGNKNLKLAAQYLSDFFFDDKGDMDNIPKGYEKKESKEDDGLKKRETQFEERRLNTFLHDTQEIVTHRMSKMITENISKMELTPYERRNLTNDIMNEIDTMIGKDSRHLSAVDSIRKSAREADYNGDWKSRLANTYLGRAKAVMEIAKKRALDKAEIKGGKNRVKKEAKRLSPSGSPGKSGTTLRAKDIDFSKTSERDILNDKVTLKVKK
jgi:hypothetical protein